jgi:biotin carboxyl carrier protein
MAKYEVSIDGRQYEVEIIRDDGRRAFLKVDGREYEVDARNVSTGSAPAPSPSPANVTPEPRRSPSVTAAPAAALGAEVPGDMQIHAPMPGLVLQVCASVGQRVKNGDALLRLEAMKMENDVQSQIEGVVKKILVAQGDEVQEGELLMVLEG